MLVLSRRVGEEISIWGGLIRITLVGSDPGKAKISPIRRER